MWLNWANVLSAFRLFAAIPCAWAIDQQLWPLAAGIYIAAVITDVSDGIIARRYNLVSPLGGLIDHSSDALFVTLLLSALAINGVVPLLLPALVLLSFVQYVLDSDALKGKTLRASQLGRWNGVAYYGMAGIPIGLMWLDTQLIAPDWIMMAGWVLVISTLVSMLDRAQALIRTLRHTGTDKT